MAILLFYPTQLSRTHNHTLANNRQCGPESIPTNSLSHTHTHTHPPGVVTPATDARWFWTRPADVQISFCRRDSLGEMGNQVSSVPFFLHHIIFGHTSIVLTLVGDWSFTTGPSTTQPERFTHLDLVALRCHAYGNLYHRAQANTRSWFAI